MDHITKDESIVDAADLLELLPQIGLSDAWKCFDYGCRWYENVWLYDDHARLMQKFLFISLLIIVIYHQVEAVQL